MRVAERHRQQFTSPAAGASRRTQELPDRVVALYIIGPIVAKVRDFDGLHLVSLFLGTATVLFEERGRENLVLLSMTRALAEWRKCDSISPEEM